MVSQISVLVNLSSLWDDSPSLRSPLLISSCSGTSICCATSAWSMPAISVYTFLDHAAAHSEKGAMGDLQVSGPAKADVYRSEDDGPPTE